MEGHDKNINCSTPEETMLKSEKAYLNCLDVAVEKFSKPLLKFCLEMKKETGVPQPISLLLERNLSNNIFLNLESIRDLSKHIVVTLQTDKNSFAEIFVRISPFLKMYSIYIQSFELSRNLLNEILKYQVFKSFISGCELKNNTELVALLRLPLDRLHSYRQLLIDKLKGTEKYHNIYSSLESGLSNLTNIILSIKDDIAKSKARNNVLKFQDLFGIPLTIPSRYFIMDDTMSKIKSNGRILTVYCVLFNDLLICASEKTSYVVASSKKEFQILGQYDLRDAIIIDFGQVENQFLILAESSKALVCIPSSVEMKSKWTSAISSHIATLHSSTSLNQRILDPSAYKKLPLWIQDGTKIRRHVLNLPASLVWSHGLIGTIQLERVDAASRNSSGLAVGSSTASALDSINVHYNDNKNNETKNSSKKSVPYTSNTNAVGSDRGVDHALAKTALDAIDESYTDEVLIHEGVGLEGEGEGEEGNDATAATATATTTGGLDGRRAGGRSSFRFSRDFASVNNPSPGSERGIAGNKSTPMFSTPRPTSDWRGKLEPFDLSDFYTPRNTAISYRHNNNNYSTCDSRPTSASSDYGCDDEWTVEDTGALYVSSHVFKFQNPEQVPNVFKEKSSDIPPPLPPPPSTSSSSSPRRIVPANISIDVNTFRKFVVLTDKGEGEGIVVSELLTRSDGTSPAESFGIRIADVVITMQTNLVSNLKDVKKCLKNLSSKEMLHIGVIRNVRPDDSNNSSNNSSYNYHSNSSSNRNSESAYERGRAGNPPGQPRYHENPNYYQNDTATVYGQNPLLAKDSYRRIPSSSSSSSPQRQTRQQGQQQQHSYYVEPVTTLSGPNSALSPPSITNNRSQSSRGIPPPHSQSSTNTYNNSSNQQQQRGDRKLHFAPEVHQPEENFASESMSRNTYSHATTVDDDADAANPSSNYHQYSYTSSEDAMPPRHRCNSSLVPEPYSLPKQVLPVARTNAQRPQQQQQQQQPKGNGNVNPALKKSFNSKPPLAFYSRNPNPSSSVTSVRAYPNPSSSVTSVRAYPNPSSSVTSVRAYPNPSSSVTSVRAYPSPSGRSGRSVHYDDDDAAAGNTYRQPQPPSGSALPSREPAPISSIHDIMTDREWASVRRQQRLEDSDSPHGLRRTQSPPSNHRELFRSRQNMKIMGRHIDIQNEDLYRRHKDFADDTLLHRMHPSYFDCALVASTESLSSSLKSSEEGGGGGGGGAGGEVSFHQAFNELKQSINEKY